MSIKGKAANLNMTSRTTDNKSNMYRVALSLKLNVLNFKAIRFIGAFIRNALMSVIKIKNHLFKIILLIVSLF